MKLRAIQRLTESKLSRIEIILLPSTSKNSKYNLSFLPKQTSCITAFVSEDVKAAHIKNAQIQEISFSNIKDFYYRLNSKLHSIIEEDISVLFVQPEYNFDDEALTNLEAALRSDSLYGFSLPRTNVGGSASIPGAHAEVLNKSTEVINTFLEHLPETYSNGIVISAPVLVKARVLYNFGRLEGKRLDLADALARLYIRANRRGYSTVTCNRALFEITNISEHSRSQTPPEINKASDYYRAIDRLAYLPERRAESLLWHQTKNKIRRRVLFDIRNLAPGYNGTAQHIISLIPYLCKICAQAKIAPYFWALENSAEFHKLDEIIDGEVIYKIPADDSFDCSVRLSQPWSFSEIRDLALHSMVNIYLVMDAIAWDCHYIRMPHIDGVWRNMAAHSDGFIYNSEFTKRAFEQRFPQARNKNSTVSYCSLRPQEYYVPEKPNAKSVKSTPPYVLVVGNQYYHKGLYDVVGMLSASFPEIQFKVLGEIKTTYINVEQFASGMIANEDIDTLFRDSACLVFPSHYEGFGLPILKALSFGKPVIARDSSLLDEIRKHVSPIKNIIPFRLKTELLRAVQEIILRIDHWTEQNHQPLEPVVNKGWESAAQQIIDLIEKTIPSASLERCLARLEFFYQINQFDIERLGWSNADQNKIIFEVEFEE
ncbi:MAG: hypothetical protein CFE50_07085 [Pseudomonas sp. PGPPP4]|nr:MAG: hypothetical protein CFE50_07085 [Pseudomonas sp. PGPPP4]